MARSLTPAHQPLATHVAIPHQQAAAVRTLIHQHAPDHQDLLLAVLGIDDTSQPT